MFTLSFWVGFRVVCSVLWSSALALSTLVVWHGNNSPTSFSILQACWSAMPQMLRDCIQSTQSTQLIHCIKLALPQFKLEGLGPSMTNPGHFVTLQSPEGVAVRRLAARSKALPLLAVSCCTKASNFSRSDLAAQNLEQRCIVDFCH